MYTACRGTNFSRAALYKMVCLILSGGRTIDELVANNSTVTGKDNGELDHSVDSSSSKLR